MRHEKYNTINREEMIKLSPGNWMRTVSLQLCKMREYTAERVNPYRSRENAWKIWVEVCAQRSVFLGEE
jgi:hypothetical protein